MASITINPVPNYGTLLGSLSGEEKLVAIDNNGKPIKIEINLILNKIDDKIDSDIQATLTQLTKFWDWEEL